MSGAKLVNVRLGPEDAMKVRVLRKRGVELSSLVRQAVRAEYAKRIGVGSGRDAVAMVREIYSEHPPQKASPRTFDVHDRRAFSVAFRHHLQKKGG